MIEIKSALFSKDFFLNERRDFVERANVGILKKKEERFLDFRDVDINNDLERIERLVEKSKNKYEDIIVLGIGGSALGTKAVFNAIKGKYYNELTREERGGYGRLYILDNVDPIEIDNLMKIIDLRRSLFIVISKSGTTIETVSQYKFFMSEIENLGEKIEEHFIIIAGENSTLKKESEIAGLEVFTIPETIGGRFSALTNVGLVPLAYVGVNVRLLLEGVKEAKEKYISLNLNVNSALYLALIQFNAYVELKRNITVFCPYITNMKYFSEWYKQLIAESLGKNELGITVVDAIGVTDQHSQLQLYYDGPDDKLIVFLGLNDYGVDYKIDQNLSFEKLLKLEEQGTRKALNDNGKINISILIDKLDEKTIGELILLFEMQTAYLGELFSFNAFNQPGVEEAKKVIYSLINEIK